MSRSDQEHWNSKYLNAKNPGKPAPVLTDNVHLLPNSGDALDLACGLGGSSLWLAKQGLSVSAWDVSSVALEKLESQARNQNLIVNCRVFDVKEEPLPSEAFDLIVVCNFQQRELCPSILNALRPGGLLAYQTFTKAKPAPHISGPNNPDYLLDRGELLSLFSGLTPVFIVKSLILVICKRG